MKKRADFTLDQYAVKVSQDLDHAGDIIVVRLTCRAEFIILFMSELRSLVGGQLTITYQQQRLSERTIGWCRRMIRWIRKFLRELGILGAVKFALLVPVMLKF